MASRYIQKYPIPQDFPSVLKAFTREVLRAQPENIIEYSARYFEALESGRPFAYKSAFNVAQDERQYQLSFDARKAEELVKKNLQINEPQGALARKEVQRINQLVDLLFSRYDKDCSGYLDGKELKTMISGIHSEGHIFGAPSDIEIMSFSSQIDTNHNGKVDKQELFNFFKSTIQ